MANKNYVLLETVTVGAAGASSITFSNIPQTGYTDLKVVASARSSNASGSVSLNISFNGSSSSFTGKYLQGAGSGTPGSGSIAQYTGDMNAASSTASTFSSTEIYIPNFTASINKSFSGDTVSENNATAAYATLTAGLWSNTAAITSITLAPNGGSFVQYSSFSLYGIAAVGTTPTVAPKASGGDIIQTDGTYWYHAFLSSGTFTPQKALACDYLVVAGGGAGGGNGGGGGGAGGYRTGTGLSVTSTAYTITVGAGGSGTSIVSPPTSGSDSVFSTITSTGGGRGGSNSGYLALTGGSGGGGGMYDVTYGGGAAGNTPSTSPAQGYAGANGLTNGNTADRGGGGGGATAAGTAGSSVPNGGAGSNSLSTWATATGTGASGYYAGGGGAGAWSNTPGTGGAGGGGNGGRDNAYPTSGTANTGGGGGGGGTSTYVNSGNGGSGIVIIRYAVTA